MDLCQQEKQAPDVDVEALYQRAIDTKLFEKNLDELVTLVEARAGYHRREVDVSGTSSRGSTIASRARLTCFPCTVPPGAEADNPDLAEIIIHVLNEGIEMTQRGSHAELTLVARL